METIKNESTAVAVYDVPELDADLVVDFIDSPDLEKMEDGIRRIEAGTDLLGLAQGVAIVRIEREGLWQQGGFTSLGAYRKVQSARLGMPSPTISARRRVAEGWLDNRKALANVPLQGHVAKLRFFNQALKKVKDKRTVVKHFKEDSYRDFAAFSRPEKKPELPEVTATFRSGVLLIDDVPVARLSDSIPEGEREFLIYLIKTAYSARKGGMIPYVIPVYNMGEGAASERLLKKYRAGK